MTTRPCLRCGTIGEPGMRFCETCGLPLADNTTRYLCAAVHRDEKYCDDAIAEFLVEPLRMIPPSPGADSAAVLRDAVAARFRRRVRDAVLLALLLIFVVTSLPLFVVWLVAAAAVRSVGGLGTGRRSRVFAVGVLLAAVVGGLLAVEMLGSSLRYAGLGPVSDYGGGVGGSTVVASLIGLLMLAVLLADGYLVHWLVHTCFRRDMFVSNPLALPAGAQQTVRGLGAAGFAAALDRVVRADRVDPQGQADVVVHRGFDPFVGAGVVVDVQLAAISLVPGEDDTARAEPERIDVVALHDHVTRALDGLRLASSLGPAGRLGDLETREQVLVSAEQLLTHNGVPPYSTVLPSLAHEPLRAIPVGEARTVAEDPEEAARYYRCYRVEAWDRDLTPSCFVHFGTDQRTLFLERVHCLLMPLGDDVREIDRPAWPLAPLVDSLLELVVLPTTVFRRGRTVLRRFRPIPQRPGEVDPGRYGAAVSLRELAAGRNCQQYFQHADAVRYRRVIDSVLQRAIGEYLEEKGYSVVEFQRAFNPTINDFRNASISQSAFGHGATTSNIFGRSADQAKESP